MRSIVVALLLLISTAAQAAQRVFITEFATARVEAQAPFSSLPALVHQPPLVLGVTAVTSAPFNNGTRYIRVYCEVQCSVRIGAGAVITDMALPPARPEYFGIQPGSKSLSVIANP